MRWFLSLSMALLFTGQAIAGTPFPVSDGVASQPDVGVWPDGRMVVVFRSGDRVHFSLLDGDVPVSQAPGETEWSPDVAVLAGGGFVTAWLSDDGEQSLARLRPFDAAGGALADPFEAGSNGNVTDLAVAPTPDGGWVVVWSQLGVPGFENVVVRIFEADGRPRTPVLPVSDDTSLYNIHPRVAVGPDGSFTVVWGTYTLHSSTAHGRRFAADGAPFEDAWILAEEAAFPAVATDAGSRRILAWSATTGRRSIAARFDEDGTQGTVLNLGGSGAGAPDLAMAPDGGAVAAWQEPEGHVRARFVDRDGQPAGTAVIVSEASVDLAHPPGAALTNGGRAVFVWVDENTGRVHGCRWEEAAVPVERAGWGAFKSAWN